MSRVAVILRSLRRSRFLRDSVFMGGIFAASELTQEAIIGVEKYDAVKICRCGVFGLCFSGPFNYGWFRLLDTVLPGNTMKIALKKLTWDTLFAVPIEVAGFFVGMDLLERKDDIFSEAKEKTLPTWLAGCAFWVPIQLINFRFILPQHRVVYVGVVLFLWANFLCYVRRRHGSQVDLSESQELTANGKT
ncbi:mpv17-like protein [Glandiceps talaboti]